MPRIPERNGRYRTKQEVCEDISTVLNLPLRWGTQYAVLADACWVWSEFDGKYDGCAYWSRKAWAARDSRKHLRHDHVVPKQLIVQELKAIRGKATPKRVRQVLAKWCVGAVITIDEDRRLTKLGLRARMPDDWNGIDSWARYTLARIALRKPNGHGREQFR